jgi:lysophospholipase L1-like esterase
MKRYARSFIAAAISMISLAAQAAEQCLVLGDSLSKEYEVEFPVLYPNHPEAWDTRNWYEILDARRHSWFDAGKESAYSDYRIVGHKHNWAFPGATTQEIRDTLSSSAWYHKRWQTELRGQLRSEVERVVIFAGGNDLDDIYGRLYQGQSASTQLTRVKNNLLWMVDYVRAVKPSLKIVLVSVPHVGVCPDVQRAYPTQVTQTGRATKAFDDLNAKLAAGAKSRGVAFADGVYAFTKAAITQPVFFSNVEIMRAADVDSRPQYLFSGDGFHPATAGQAKIAQSILNAFRIRWPSPGIPVLSDDEILSSVLDLR